MTSESLDEVDRGILYLLQGDARDRTTVEMGERLGVSSSTVASRIAAMEERGVITGYQPSIDYEKTDLEHHFLVIGSVPFDGQSSVLDAIEGVSGVVGARELLTNEVNVSIEFVGRTRTDVEETVAALDEAGVAIERMEMVRDQHRQPYADFGKRYTTADDG